MSTLAELREKIDRVDDELVAVLRRRFELTREVRSLKQAAELPPKDEQREREIMARAMAAVEPSDRDTVAGVYERIFNGSRGVIETIARGVCQQNGKVLLCRAKGSKTTYLPGGHIEFGETGREALVRELKEETGLEAVAGDFLGVVENSFLQHNERHCEINLIYRLDLMGTVPEDLVGTVPATVVAKEPWIEFQWWDLDQLQNANLLPAEMIKYA